MHRCGEDLTQFACIYSGNDLISDLIKFSHILGLILKVHTKLKCDPGGMEVNLLRAKQFGWQLEENYGQVLNAG